MPTTSPLALQFRLGLYTVKVALSWPVESGSSSRSVLPIIGMWVNAGIESSTSRYAYDCYDYCPSYNNRGCVAGWAIAGLVQASGFARFLVGLGTGPEKIERFPLRFSAGPAPDGGMQFGMNGKF